MPELLSESQLDYAIQSLKEGNSCGLANMLNKHVYQERVKIWREIKEEIRQRKDTGETSLPELVIDADQDTKFLKVEMKTNPLANIPIVGSNFSEPIYYSRGEGPGQGTANNGRQVCIRS